MRASGGAGTLGPARMRRALSVGQGILTRRSAPAGGAGKPAQTGAGFAGGGERREGEQGLPQVPAPALAVALATWRAGCSAEAALGKPDCSAPAWSSVPVAGVSLHAPGGSAGEDAGRRGEERRGWRCGRG